MIKGSLQYCILAGQNEFVDAEGLCADMAQKEAAEKGVVLPSPNDIGRSPKLQNCSEEDQDPLL